MFDLSVPRLAVDNVAFHPICLHRTDTVKLNAKKCHLVQEKCVILGHLVSKEGISTDPEKTQVIRHWPIPNNISDLRSFLGCIGYYCQFIRDFVKIAEPSYKLERKGTVYNWNKESDVAFQTLKQKLISAPILAYPRLDLSFTLDTDACDTGSEQYCRKSKKMGRGQSPLQREP